MNLPFLNPGARVASLGFIASLGFMPVVVVSPRVYKSLRIYAVYPPAPYHADDVNKSLGGRINRLLAHRLWGDYMRVELPPVRMKL